MEKSFFIFSAIIASFLVFGLSSCKHEKDQPKPAAPLEGAWKVTEVMTLVGVTKEDGSFERHKPAVYTEGDFGSFDFTKDEVSYTIKHDSIALSGNDNWKVDAQLGRHHVETLYTLTIGSNQRYSLVYGQEEKEVKGANLLLQDEIMITREKTLNDTTMIGFVLKKK